VDEVPGRWVRALVESVVPNVVAAVADIESSVAAAQLETYFVAHMSLTVRRGGGCRMVLGKQGLLLKQMSSCSGCSEGVPVCPSGVEFGRSGLESDWCLKSPHLDCSALERSTRNELGGLVLGASSGLGDHVLG